jgi:thiamine-phosphate pyrophosphorylase
MIRCYVTDRRQGDITIFARKAVEQNVDFIQIREKDLSANELTALAIQIRDIARDTKTRVLVNERLDVALAADVDGVHLPGNGLPAHRVRGLVRVLGVSVHSVLEARAAEEAGADFIIFGAIFETAGKVAVGLQALRSVANAVKIPILAIGGITPSNTAEVIAAGADGIAGIRMFQN